MIASFHNPIPPNVEISHERPEHRLIVWFKAQGATLAEIADATGYSVAWISQVLRQPWAQHLLAEILDSAGNSQVKRMFDAAAPIAVEELVRIAMDSKERGSTRVAAITAILDRHLGKPVQHITHASADDLDKLSDTELIAIIRDRRRATPAEEASTAFSD